MRGVAVGLLSGAPAQLDRQPNPGGIGPRSSQACLHRREAIRGHFDLHRSLNAGLVAEEVVVLHIICIDGAGSVDSEIGIARPGRPGIARAGGRFLCMMAKPRASAKRTTARVIFSPQNRNA